MNYWRVTKFNPNFRERGPDSPYTIDTWIQVEDLQYKKMSVEEYLKIEDLYVRACFEFVKESKIKELDVVDFINDMSISNLLVRNNLFIKDDRKKLKKILVEELEDIVKKNLRGIVYCKLEVKGEFFIHFGYDFYMYIGSKYPCDKAILSVSDSGLFVEDFVSPYL